MSAALTEQLVAIARAARQVGHGKKTSIYRKACEELQLSYATLQRKLKEVIVTDKRKRRTDAGQTALTYEEAQLIAAMLMDSFRRNNKRLYTVEKAVEVLRANGEIKASYTDTETGEILPLSTSAITRALRQYGLHPEQLMAPDPVTPLASKHPNHVWEMDASLCTLYYLSNGVHGMPAEVYYKNKPGNMERISANRVWRYVITDHTSGWLYAEYVLGAESGENLCSVLINAMQERDGQDVLHGIPKMLMLDPGAANTAGMTRNLCRSLGIELLINKPGNARAKGQAENAHNLVETKLEPGLKLQCVNGLDALNAIAKKWRIQFNATARHGRTGTSRTLAWVSIQSDQLVKAPSVEICRELAVAQPESRKVSPALQVSFRGTEYDVSTVPSVMVGEKLLITCNPWRDSAQVVQVDEAGHEIYHVVHAVQRDEWGFAKDAPVIGESYKRHADTPAQTAAKAIEQLVTDTDSQADAKAARKAGRLPFGGRIDPYKHIDDTKLPLFLPKKGTPHELIAPEVVFPPLSHVEAAKQIKSRIGDTWTAEQYQWLVQRFPDGVPVEAVDEVVRELSGQQAPLRAIAGGKR
ncbi:MAG: DDE-type integrase/transposase/recombinase [Burkholderiaceae bacterium]|jgi:hypothetical protein|nr:DDE-type integrase/transposase/recombinase [Burkholderiaceae bacterium]